MSDVLESTIRKHGQIKNGKNILLVWADLAKAVAISISFIKCLEVPLNKSPTFSSFLWGGSIQDPLWKYAAMSSLWKHGLWSVLWLLNVVASIGAFHLIGKQFCCLSIQPAKRLRCPHHPPLLSSLVLNDRQSSPVLLGRRDKRRADHYLWEGNSTGSWTPLPGTLTCFIQSLKACC